MARGKTAARQAALTQSALVKRWRQYGTHLFVIWVLALLAYSNSFQGALVFDSASVIGRDIRIREMRADNLKLILTQGYWYGRADAALYRPLSTLSYLFNYAVLGSGPNPTSYHWVNFVIHTVNIALVYLLALSLLQSTRLAFATAAIWAVHPALTESVTNIVGRADLLAGFGVLAGLLCHIRASASAGRRQTAWLVAVAVASTVGIFSKESGIVILAAMAIYDVTFLSASSWRARLPGYLAAGGPVLVYLLVRSRVLAGVAVDPIPFVDNPLVAVDFWTAHLTAIKVFVLYAGLLIWPLRLSCDYSYHQIPLSGWGDWRALVSLILVIGAAVAAMILRRRAKAIHYLIGFFFAALAPTSNLFFPIGTIMAERFLYLPAIAVVGCGVLAWKAAGERWTHANSLTRPIVVAICTILLVRTWIRNSDWENDRNLWSSAVDAVSGSFKAHTNLAAATPEAPENRDLGLRESHLALTIVDSLPDEWNSASPFSNAGRWYRIAGDLAAMADEKEGWYHKALDVLLRGRRIDQAWSRRSGQEVGTEGVYLELGRVYERMSQRGEALEALEYGRRVTQGSEISEELAAILHANGELERAAISYLEALSLNPERVTIAGKLVQIYQQLDPHGCSLVNGNLNLNCPLVHRDLCLSAQNMEQLYRGASREVAAKSLRSQAILTFGCSG